MRPTAARTRRVLVIDGETQRDGPVDESAESSSNARGIADGPVAFCEGRYAVKRLLGEGSMGRTYLTVDTVDGGHVAVKSLYPSRLAEWKDLELFRREAKILQRLDHPQIPAYVNAFEEGEGEGVAYCLAQTYVEGQTLRHVLSAGKRFSEAEILSFAKGLLGVLGYLHGQDPPVVHRDIKPDNLILSALGGRPMLVDFGAVREVVRLTMGGGSTVVGTYGYMPPEQLMGRALPATDLYAVGITVLECLTHQKPGDLLGAEALRLIDQTQVSEGAKRVLRRLCAPRLNERYQDAASVLADVERVSSGGLPEAAQKLEQAIAVKDKAEERQLREQSGMKLTWVQLIAGSVGVVTLAGGSVGFYLFVTAIAQTFAAGFLSGLAVSGVGILLLLFLLVQRYTHDAWAPPDGTWVEATAELKDVSVREGLDAYGQLAKVGLDMEFEIGRSTMEADLSHPLSRYFIRRYSTHAELILKQQAVDQRQMQPGALGLFKGYEEACEELLQHVGTKARVYYHPRSPNSMEVEDIEYEEGQESLFDRAVLHTPE
jgi:hypothetical protein